VATVHAVAAVAAALLGAALLLAGDPIAVWLLLLAGLAGISGCLAYVLLQDEEAHTLAGGVLLASQVGILGWGLWLVGPRPALLALVPALMLLALRCAGRIAATLFVCAILVVYIAVTVLVLQFGLPPAIQLGSLEAVLLDGACVCTGLLLVLIGALGAADRRARAELLAQARQREVRMLRMKIVQLRQQTEVEAELLYNAADAALQGKRFVRAKALESVFSPVAERVGTVGETIAELRAVRDEHRRLESALRRLTRALERGWLGLRWTWPGPTGTQMDELVALLRTPRPQDAEALPLGETPAGLVRIPTTDPKLLAYRQGAGPHRALRQGERTAVAWSEMTHARTNDEPRISRRSGPLPWDEWDNVWRPWQDEKVDE
jgi:hypothetical protein